ncbi:MAG: cysteine dioxygenase family protein [Acidobacteria bacterium]|nr:cysteine dioxygenase family protein [Acidobacteriota bacterium]
MAKRVSINDVMKGLSQIFTDELTPEQVHEYLLENKVDEATLEPYIRFGERSYTRNLIHKEDLFEAVLLCWEPGQHSPVHRHLDQWGWMTVLKGQLIVTNFIKLRSEIVESEEPDVNWSRINSIYLKEGHHHTVTGGEVFLEATKPETIHKTENPASHERQAISLHICTRPSDTSVIYDVENHRCRTVRMGYV